MNFEQSEHDEMPEPFQLPSMVDLVFILLSFFLLATQLRTLERDFTSAYRSDATGQAAAVDLPSNVRVELRRVPMGVAIRIGRAEVAVNDFEGIRETLGMINLPETEVIVAAEPDLTVDQVARAVDAVLESPMKKVSLSRLGRRRP